MFRELIAVLLYIYMLNKLCAYKQTIQTVLLYRYASTIVRINITGAKMVAPPPWIFRAYVKKSTLAYTILTIVSIYIYITEILIQNNTSL